MKFTTAACTSRARICKRPILMALSLVIAIPQCLAPAQSDRPRPGLSAGVQTDVQNDVRNGVQNDVRNDTRIGVFGLFHPKQFTVIATAGRALELRGGGEVVVIEKSSGAGAATLCIGENDVLVVAGTRRIRASKVAVFGRGGDPVDFVLAIPNKITRHFRGTLEIEPSNGELIAIVAMDREIAVASAVAAESAPDTPLEALKALAVASRSYFAVSRGRHRDFDFCDTTHCQFLREPPAAGNVTRSVADTRGLVLAYDFHPFAAMYTRSCSGRTHTPAEVGIRSAEYPYYSVECPHCRSHPAHWTSQISARNAAGLRSSSESSRLRVDRHLGWSTVPSNDFIIRRDGDQIILEGVGQGHGIGLCQTGAKAMAEEGAGFREILNHYYPNAEIVNWSAHSSSEGDYGGSLQAARHR